MCETKSSTLILMSLKQSTYLDNLKKSVSGLKGMIPNFGLPKWKHLPLESKIPMVPGLQSNVYAFARRKLGEPLRIRLRCAKHQPFDTTDPYNVDVQLPYEGMHDKHLTRYFENPNVKNFMLKAGLITSQMDVKCSLKEYNNYRNYLRVMNGKMMSDELDQRDEIHREKILLSIADNQTLKKIERLKKDDVRDNLYKKIQEKKEQKLQEILIKDKEKDKKVEIMKELKNQRIQNKKIELQSKLNNIKQKRVIMAKKDEQKLLNALNKMYERDTLLRKTREKNLIKKHSDKITSSLNRFEQRKSIQEKQIEKEILAKQYAETLKQTFLEIYKKRIDENQRKFQDLLNFKKEALNKSLQIKHKKKNNEINICHCKRKSIK